MVKHYVLFFHTKTKKCYKIKLFLINSVLKLLFIQYIMWSTKLQFVNVSTTLWGYFRSGFNL